MSVLGTVYRPAAGAARPPVHLNFHGGGFVMRGVWLDDPLCRCLAATTGVVVVNVDYVVAGADHGYDGTDGNDVAKARGTYALIARHLTERR